MLWLIPLLLLIGGGVVYEEKKKSAANPAPPAPGSDPKSQYNQGFSDGAAAGTKDKAAGVTTPNVPTTLDQLNQLFKNPAAWSTDPAKSYTLGYGLGYYSTFGSTPAPQPQNAGGGGSGLPGTGPGMAKDYGILPALKTSKPTPVSPAIKMAITELAPVRATSIFTLATGPSDTDAYNSGYATGKNNAMAVVYPLKNLQASDFQPPAGSSSWSADVLAKWNQGYADGYSNEYPTVIAATTDANSRMSWPTDADSAYNAGNLLGLMSGYATGSGLPAPNFNYPAPTSWPADIQSKFNQGFSDGVVASNPNGQANPICSAGMHFDVTQGICVGLRATPPPAHSGAVAETNAAIMNKISPEWRNQVPSWFTDKRFYG